MSQQPTIGRIVHAVIKNAHGVLVVRPAIITRTWGGSPCVQATVFPDSVNDGLGDTVGKSSLQHCEAAVNENTWHWPVRELPLTARLESTAPVDWVSLHKRASELCYAIEKLPASSQATELSVQASALAGQIQQLSFPNQPKN